MENVGERVRKLRMAAGLSQRELAGPGVTYAYVSRIEAGQRRPSERALRSLAERLGTTAQYLESGSGEGLCPHCGRF
jgi:transcriptional regulator with XRE-family HTH domain